MKGNHLDAFTQASIALCEGVRDEHLSMAQFMTGPCASAGAAGASTEIIRLRR